MTELSIHCPLLCSVSFIQRTYPYLASSRLPQRIDCIGLLMHSQFLSCRSIICAVSEFLLSAVGAKTLTRQDFDCLGVRSQCDENGPSILYLHPKTATYSLCSLCLIRKRIAWQGAMYRSIVGRISLLLHRQGQSE